MRRLGIAIVVQNIDSTGGMERQALQLAKRLVARGARVWILSTIHTSGLVPKRPAGVRWVERHGRLTIYRVPMSVDWMLEWCNSLYELAIASVLGVRTPALDVIYAIQWMTARHALLVARFLDCPLFVKFAGGGVYGDFSVIGRNPERETILAELATAERLVCISPQIASEASTAGLPREHLLRIPNGVDLTRFENVRPAPLPGPEGSEHVLFVGALRAEKRLPDLVRTVAEVARIRPLAQLVIAGAGVEEPAIRAVVSELGLEERVHFLGNRKDVPELLAAAHVFVLPSVSEGLSNALLEALASGTPIVATDIEGTRAVVEHEKEALLVPLGDSDALGRAIVRLLEDHELAARLSRAGRQRVREYGLDEVARTYERAIRGVARPLPNPLRIVMAVTFKLACSLVWVEPEDMFRVRFVRGLAWRVASIFVNAARIRTRESITRAVVSMKRTLGIDGEILTWSRDRGSSQARSKT
jgi:glycosyltransferase involved in cell wall biosynthesis